MQPYTLVRSKRKTVALYIRNGAVEVRAPYRVAKSIIDRFVASKADWITEKLAHSSERAESRGNFRLAYGDEVTYRGTRYPIVPKEGRRIGFDGNCFYMPPNLDSEQIKNACIQVYRMLAKRDLTEKVRFYSERMGATPAAIKVNGAQSRWGSCSAKKNINFSWRLIMAQDDVIDYVVVHELAHLFEMNHSNRFWAVVEGVLPDYQKRQTQLKELQDRLSGENWGDRKTLEMK